MKVLIAGAGIGGLTAALAALRKGFDVEVYEQAGELKEVGAGLQERTRGALPAARRQGDEFRRRARAQRLAGRVLERAGHHRRGARAYVEREWAGHHVAERYEWLFRYDVTTAAV